MSVSQINEFKQHFALRKRKFVVRDEKPPRTFDKPIFLTKKLVQWAYSIKTRLYEQQHTETCKGPVTNH